MLQACYNLTIVTYCSHYYRGNKVEDLDKYITALHDLNEVKDSAQLIMGKLGEKTPLCFNIHIYSLA